jgi:hypothetical protein
MKRLLSIAGCIGALVVATPVFAADFLPGFVGPSPDGNGAATFIVLSGNPSSGPISATYSRTGLDTGIFTDRFLFTIDQNGLGSGSITTILSGLSGGAGDLDFLNVTFFNGTTTFDVNTGPNGALEQGGLLNVPITFGVQNVLTVNYESRGEGAFSGVLSFSPTAPIPEPATWAMMLVGFGAIGFAMRRRNAVTRNVNLNFS